MLWPWSGHTLGAGWMRKYTNVGHLRRPLTGLCAISYKCWASPMPSVHLLDLMLQSVEAIFL